MKLVFVFTLLLTAIMSLCITPNNSTSIIALKEASKFKVFMQKGLKWIKELLKSTDPSNS